MITYEVTITLDIGHLDVEVEFDANDYEPTDDEIHDAAIEVIEEELSRSKLAWYQKRYRTR